MGYSLGAPRLYLGYSPDFTRVKSVRGGNLGGYTGLPYVKFAYNEAIWSTYNTSSRVTMYGMKVHIRTNCGLSDPTCVNIKEEDNK